jgi:hypothetical protein
MKIDKYDKYQISNAQEVRFTLKQNNADKYVLTWLDFSCNM